MITAAIDAPDGAGDGVLRRSAFSSGLAAMVSSSVFREACAVVKTLQCCPCFVSVTLLHTFKFPSYLHAAQRR